MNLVVWFFLLVAQNAAFTWVSRARNSRSVGYHAIASVASNAIFFCTNLMLIGIATLQGLTHRQLAVAFLVYVAGTVTGSVLMHWVSMRWLEAGKRKVGS